MRRKFLKSQIVCIKTEKATEEFNFQKVKFVCIRTKRNTKGIQEKCDTRTCECKKTSLGSLGATVTLLRLPVIAQSCGILWGLMMPSWTPAAA